MDDLILGPRHEEADPDPETVPDEVGVSKRIVLDDIDW